MSPQHVGIVDAIKLFFNNYTNFSARSTRSEYWWWVLANVIAIGALQFLNVIAIFSGSGGLATFVIILMVVYCLGILVPSISLSIRRLHDIGKPGTWFLITLIPFVGAIILLVLTLQPSAPANEWGEPAKN